MSESSTLQPGQSIKPNASKEDAIRLIDRFFGVTVTKIKELNSYDDINFYVEGTNGEEQGKYVFKILNSMDSQKPGHIIAEGNAMLLLSERGINCCVPKKTKDGRLFATVLIGSENEEDMTNGNISDKKVHIIRLLKYVEGDLFAETKLTEKLIYDTGKFLATMDNVLEELDSTPLEGHTSIWQLKSVPALRKFIYVFDDKPERKGLVERIISEFEHRVEPLYPSMQLVPIHGDFNEQNVVCTKVNETESQIAGVIDFGDMHIGYHVFELAIIMCYMMLECVKPQNSLDPLEGAGHVLAGYLAEKKLNENELSILRTCIASRLCQSLVMGAYTYSQDPGNEYLLTTQNSGWPILENLWNCCSDEKARSVWDRIIKAHKQ